LSSSTIVVDVSNVAWADGSREGGDRARLANVLLVIEELHARGVSQVICIADATLEYDVDDREGLQRTRHAGELRVVPSGTPADDFILQKAQRENARIVSNDRFADWASQDPEVVAYVQRARVGFLIVEGSVEFSPRIP
jgi:hypothetical protein